MRMFRHVHVTVAVVHFPIANVNLIRQAGYHWNQNKDISAINIDSSGDQCTCNSSQPNVAGELIQLL